MKRRLIVALSLMAIVSIGAYEAISNIQTEANNLKEVVDNAEKSNKLLTEEKKQVAPSNLYSINGKLKDEVNKLKDSAIINTDKRFDVAVADDESIIGLDKPSNDPINGFNKPINGSANVSNKPNNESIDELDKPNTGNNTDNNIGSGVDKPTDGSVGDLDKPHVDDNTDETGNSNGNNNESNADNNTGNDEVAISQENVAKVVKLINGIDSSLILEDEHSLDRIERSLGDIEAEYKQLTEEEQGLVTNYEKLENAKAHMVVIRSQLHLVYDAIIAIPEQITKESLVEAEAAVVKAEEAYGRLKEEHKKGVTPSEYSIIERSRWQIERLKETISTENVAKVVKLINGIDSSLTLEDEHSLDKIERSLGDIEAEYKQLTEEEQGLVTNYNKLENAKADVVVVRSQLHLVYDAIIEIPEQITKENLVEAEAAVVKAEEAYGRLKEEHKKGVTPSEYSIIERSRWQIERLKETIATENLDKVINL